MPLLPAHQHGAQWPAAEQMHVQVKHLLIGVAVAIDQQAIAALGHALLFSDALANREHMAQRLFILGHDIVDRGDLFVGYDEDTNRRLGMVSRKAVS